MAGRLAGAADEVVGPPYTDADEGRGQEAPSLGISTARDDAAGARPPAIARTEITIATERGARFVWPDLDAPYYGDPAAAQVRLALKAWRNGTTTLDAPPVHGSAAERYLAADVTYLRALVGRDDPLDAIAAYERAVRAAPAFPDAPRALVMVGFVSLSLGLVPEAELAFGRALAEHGTSPYAVVATLGHAIAERTRHRLDEARATLATLPDPVPAALRCDVVAERAALARAMRNDADAVALDETLARECGERAETPTALFARADSLLAVGRRAEARRLLASPPDGLDAEARAAILERAADLAREDGDLGAARAALDRATGLRIGPATRLVVQGRLARLDASVAPERAIAALEALVGRAPSAAARTELTGLVAETLADAGRFADAIARLAVPEEAPAADAEALLAHRDGILARWIAERDAAHDPAGVVTVYALHRTALDTRGAASTARLVAAALGLVGLPAPALRVLRLRDPGDDPAMSVAIADAALAAGDLPVAREMAGRLGRSTLPAPLVLERERLAARIAADARAAGGGDPSRDADAVPGGLTAVDDPVVRRGVALLATTRAFGAGLVPAGASEGSRGR